MTLLRRELLLGLAASLALMGTSYAADPIKLAAPFNVTGAVSSLDAPALNGAKLKVAEINAAGGVLGRPLELVIFDTKSDMTTIATVASQLVGGGKLTAGLGFTDSDSALALGPIFQKAGIPFVTPGATSPKLPDQVGDTMFLACFGDNVQAAAGAEFVLNNLKAKKVFLLRDNSSEYTTLLAKYFEEAFTKGGGALIGHDDYKAGDKSLAAQITKIKALADKPEVIFISALPDDIGLVVKQFRQSGLMQPIVGGDGYDTPLLISVGGKASNDVYFSTHAYMAADGTKPIQAFMTAYKAANKVDPENAFAALGYDTVALIADAIKRAGSDDPAKVKEALAATKGFEGITGTISYRPGVRVPDKTATIIGAKDEKLFLAGQVTPSFVPAP